MTHADFETIYDAMARQIDAVGADKSELYLAKLSLLLAQQIGDAAPVLEAISSAAKSLDA